MKASTAMKSYAVKDAVKMVKARAKAKFDETIEIAMTLGVDPRHADQTVRGMVSLPNGTGKTIRVAVFAKGDRAQQAQAAGADIVGAEDLAEKVLAGQIDFDRVIATPDMMAVVGKLGKVLGPRGLMPNPKLGTVTPNVAQAVKDAKGGQVQFRADKTGIVNAGVGKASFTEDALLANVNAFVDAINSARPTGVKGTYIKKVTLSSTMGPGVKLDLAGFAAAWRRLPSKRIPPPSGPTEPVWRRWHTEGAAPRGPAASPVRDCRRCRAGESGGGLIRRKACIDRGRNRRRLSSRQGGVRASRRELLGQVESGLVRPVMRDRRGRRCNPAPADPKPQGRDQRTQTWRRSVDRSQKEKLVASLNDNAEGCRRWSS